MIKGYFPLKHFAKINANMCVNSDAKRYAKVWTKIFLRSPTEAVTEGISDFALDLPA